MEKAVNSSETKKHYDYDAGFSDCQKLQKLTVSLSLAQQILSAHEDVCVMLESMEIEPDLMLGNIRRIRGFIRTAASLEKSAEGISQLVSSCYLPSHFRQRGLVTVTGTKKSISMAAVEAPGIPEV